MPPHCDTLDGPVAKACKDALRTGNVNIVLPWAPKGAEAEIVRAFKSTLNARKLGKPAARVADYWFFETVVRLHRRGEGVAYTGLKPAGLDWGPVVPKADRAIATGNPEKVIAFLQSTVQKELEKRFHHAMEKKTYDVDDVDAARDYVHAMLGFVLFSHGVYALLTGKGEHDEAKEGGDGH